MFTIYHNQTDTDEIFGNCLKSIPDIQLAIIDDLNMYKLIPETIDQIPILTYCVTVEANTHFAIPRHADILFSVEILENCNSKLFMYDWTGSREVVYAELDQSGKLEPFGIDGIPLIPVSTNIYLNVSKPSKIKIKYGFLDSPSRRLLGRSRDLRLKHTNGDTYEILGTEYYGHSPNYIQKS